MGLGGLYIYSFLIVTYYQDLIPLDGSAAAVALAIIPPFSVWGISKQFNRRLVKLLAEEKVAEAYVQIKANQGSKEFYNAYSEDLKEEFDDLDELFHTQIINILSGCTITVSALVLGLVEYGKFGLVGVGGSVVLSALSAYTLGVASYRKIIEILDYSTRISKTSNEA